MSKKKKSQQPKKIKEKSQRLRETLLDFSSFRFTDHKWALSILFVLPILLYIQSVNFGYVLDDKIVITDNAYTKKGISGVPKIMTTESFEGYFEEQRVLVQGGRYRPLSIATFAIEHSVSKTNPRLSHWINIILYSIVGLLLYRLLFFFYPLTSRWWFSVPFVLSILYMVHPIHVEAVANIKGRDEIMAFGFGLLAMYLSLKSLVAKRSLLTLIGVAVTYYLGILSKENILTFLGVIPLMLYIFHRKDYKKIGIVFGVLFGVTILYLIQRYLIIGFLINPEPVTDIMNNPFVGMTLGERYATITYTLGKYLSLILIPHPLTHDYYPYQIPIMSWANPSVIISLLIYGGATILAIVKHRTYPHLSFAWLFYLLPLLIVSNLLVSVGTFMNERFAFISSLGILWIIVHLLFYESKRWLSPKTATLICGLIAIAFSVKTVLRVPVWENTMTLNRAAVKVSTQSARANSFMGTALFEQYKEASSGEEKKQLLIEADYYVDKALEILPNYGNANLMAAGIAAEQFRADRDFDKLLADFEEVLLRSPGTMYVGEYMPFYHEEPQYKERALEFYARVGEGLRKQRNYNWALHHLAIGNKINQNHRNIRKTIAATYRDMGEENKARQFD